MPCERCGGPFTRPWQTRFCGHKCRAQSAADKARIPLVYPCKICGTVTDHRPAKPGVGVVCSDACLRESRRRVGKANTAAGKAPPRNVMTDGQREAARQRLTGPNAPWWNGAKDRARVHYKMVQPRDYPYPESLDSKGCIAVHRAAMETHLGRALLPAEVVHHVNEDPRDNRIENLMLFANDGEHQRFHRVKR